VAAQFVAPRVVLSSRELVCQLVTPKEHWSIDDAQSDGRTYALYFGSKPKVYTLEEQQQKPDIRRSDIYFRNYEEDSHIT
jgi:hypothetical protein